MKLSVPSKMLLQATALVAGLFTAGGILAATPECAISKNTVSLTDGNMAYETVGSGQPVVLVHGLFANKEQWNPMVCKLAAAGWQVVVPDLPGFGASTDFKAADDYKLERQVEHLDQFLTALKLPTIQLAGNSMGGAITTLYTRTHPERVKSLTLIGAPLGLGGWSPEVEAVLKRGDIPFIPLSPAAYDEELALLMVRPPVPSAASKTRAVTDYQARYDHYKMVWDTVNGYGDVLCKTPQKTVAPMLVMWGRQDHIFSANNAPAAERCLPGAKVVMLEKSGHLPQYEDADAMVAAWLEFQAGLAATPKQ
jgi:abhydrolase domain-containing protein 6